MKSSFAKIINSETPVLIDFYADWCGPCKMMAPILKQVKDEMGEAIKIVKIDVDKNQTLATKYQERGYPKENNQAHCRRSIALLNDEPSDNSEIDEPDEMACDADTQHPAEHRVLERTRTTPKSSTSMKGCPRHLLVSKSRFRGSR